MRPRRGRLKMAGSKPITPWVAALKAQRINAWTSMICIKLRLR